MWLVDIVLNNTGNKERALFSESDNLDLSLDHTTSMDIYKTLLLKCLLFCSVWG